LAIIPPTRSAAFSMNATISKPAKAEVTVWKKSLVENRYYWPATFNYSVMTV